MKQSSLCVITLLLAGCMSSPTSERVAGVYTLFDPATGMTYNVPLRHTLMARAPGPVAAVSPSTSDRLDAPAFGSSPTSGPQSALTFIASAGPVVIASQPLAPEGGISAESPRAPFVPSRDTVQSTTEVRRVSEGSPALHLKLDMEFASAKRLVIFGVGMASLGPIGKLAVAELVPWAK